MLGYLFSTKDAFRKNISKIYLILLKMSYLHKEYIIMSKIDKHISMFNITN